MKTQLLTTILLLFINSFTFAQFEWINPLPQGNTLHALHVVNEQIIYTAGWHGTILKSSDGGNSWEIKNSGTREWLHDIYFSDEDNGFAVGRNNTVLKTNDGGNTWQSIDFDFYDDLNSVYAANASRAIVCGDNGVLISTNNGGLDWQVLNSGTDYDLRSIEFVTEEIGFIVGGLSSHLGVILKTTDRGYNWTVLHPNFPKSLYSCSFTSPLVGYANNYSSIYKTIDGGLNWDMISQHGSRHIKFKDDIGISCSYGGVKRTIDGGINWHNCYAEDLQYSANAIEFINENKVFLAGAAGVIETSIDTGLNYYGNQNTMTVKTILSVYKFNDAIIAPGQGGIIKSTDNGNSWDFTKVQMPNQPYSFHFLNENIGFMTTSGPYTPNKAYKTIDGGNNWSQLTLNANNKAGNTTESRDIDPYQIYMVNELQGYLVGSWQGQVSPIIPILYRTIDGKNFDRQETPTDSVSYYKAYFKNQDTGFILSSDDKLVITYNSGNDWTTIPLPRNMKQKDILFTDSKTGYIAGNGDTSNYILKSDDGGMSWKVNYKESANNYIGDLFKHICFYDKQNGYATAVSKRMLYTNNAGDTWTPIDNIPSGNTISGMVLDGPNSGFICGSYGNLIRFDNITFTEETYTDKKEVLVFPNPSIGNLMIKSSDFSDDIECRIYNLQGQIIDEFILDKQEFKYNFAKAAKNGIYYLQITDGQKVKSEKVVLVR